MHSSSHIRDKIEDKSNQSNKSDLSNYQESSAHSGRFDVKKTNDTYTNRIDQSDKCIEQHSNHSNFRDGSTHDNTQASPNTREPNSGHNGSSNRGYWSDTHTPHDIIPGRHMNDGSNKVNLPNEETCKPDDRVYITYFLHALELERLLFVSMNVTKEANQMEQEIDEHEMMNKILSNENKTIRCELDEIIKECHHKNHLILELHDKNKALENILREKGSHNTLSTDNQKANQLDHKERISDIDRIVRELLDEKESRQIKINEQIRARELGDLYFQEYINENGLITNASFDESMIARECEYHPSYAQKASGEIHPSEDSHEEIDQSYLYSRAARIDKYTPHNKQSEISNTNYNRDQDRPIQNSYQFFKSIRKSNGHLKSSILEKMNKMKKMNKNNVRYNEFSNNHMQRDDVSESSKGTVK